MNHLIFDTKSWIVSFVHLFVKLYYISNKSIIDSIIQLYKTTRFHQSILTPKQSFFMYQSPKFISICRDENSNEIINLMREYFIRYTFTCCFQNR